MILHKDKETQIKKPHEKNNSIQPGLAMTITLLYTKPKKSDWPSTTL